jgi:hypothetical protein
MNISMALCETECRSALCRGSKKNVLKVFVPDPLRYGDAAEYEMFLPTEDAMDAFEDKAGFAKRNRIREDARTVYLDRLKDASDRAILEKRTERTYTGWIDVSKLDEKAGKALIAGASTDDLLTEWNMISFDEMAAVCAKCSLSWDKGRGCIGPFGPDNSALPDIASRAGCEITASVPDGAASKRIYTKEDASMLLKELPGLRDALTKEGKLAVRRYAGTADRLEAVAKLSVEEGCGFIFF